MFERKSVKPGSPEHIKAAKEGFYKINETGDRVILGRFNHQKYLTNRISEIMATTTTWPEGMQN